MKYKRFRFKPRIATIHHSDLKPYQEQPVDWNKEYEDLKNKPIELSENLNLDGYKEHWWPWNKEDYQ